MISIYFCTMEPTDVDRVMFDRSLTRPDHQTASFHHHHHHHHSSPSKQLHAKQAGHRFTQLFFGPDFVIRPWYSSPFPSEYYRPDGFIWICDKCLKYFAQQTPFVQHISKCYLVPGYEVYREGDATDKQQVVLSVFKLDGAKDKPTCQSLCLLAKMFLDHKTLYYDTESFLFYILIEWITQKNESTSTPTPTLLLQPRIVGYFSKEKQSPSGYNLSCILVLPQHQRKGYGSFLIDLSYLLARKDGLVDGSSPEKPLSDLGLLSYVKYWTNQVIRYKHFLIKHPNNHGLKQMVKTTGMTSNDIMATLEYLGAVWRSSDNHRTVFIRPNLIQEAKKENGSGMTAAATTTMMKRVKPQLYSDPY